MLITALYYHSSSSPPSFVKFRDSAVSKDCRQAIAENTAIIEAINATDINSLRDAPRKNVRPSNPRD